MQLPYDHQIRMKITIPTWKIAELAVGDTHRKNLWERLDETASADRQLLIVGCSIAVIPAVIAGFCCLLVTISSTGSN